MLLLRYYIFLGIPPLIVLKLQRVKPNQNIIFILLLHVNRAVKMELAKPSRKLKIVHMLVARTSCFEKFSRGPRDGVSLRDGAANGGD